MNLGALPKPLFSVGSHNLFILYAGNPIILHYPLLKCLGRTQDESFLLLNFPGVQNGLQFDDPFLVSRGFDGHREDVAAGWLRNWL